MPIPITLSLTDQLDCYLLHPARQLVFYLIHLLFHLLSHHRLSNSIPISPLTPSKPIFLIPNLPAILITSHHDQNSLPLHLALNFAANGYHVFFQVSSQANLADVIVRWQRLKSSLNKRFLSNPPLSPNNPSALKISHSIYSPSLFALPFASIPFNFSSPIGSLIPLLYLSNDLPQRLEAISTIAAYLRHNAIDMLCLINILHPFHIRNPASSQRSPSDAPPNPSRSQRSVSSSSHSPPLPSRPLTGFSSPSPSDHSSHFPCPPSLRTARPLSPTSSSSPHSPPAADFYPSAPLPLAITTDSFMLDALNDLLIAPLSTIQDLLPLLHSHKGRVINIWDGPWKPQPGLPGLLRDALARITGTLHAELEPLGIPVSIVFAPPQSPRNMPRPSPSRPATITRDVRSILTESSDPDILEIFTAQGTRQHADHGLRRPTDPVRTFAMTRAVLETRFPGRSYPIGMRELAREIARVRGPVGWVFGALGEAGW